DRVRRVDRLVRVGLTGDVRVRRDLPAGEVDGLETGLDLLDGLVAGQGAQGVDEVLGVEEVPQALGAVAGQRVLLDEGAAELDDVLCRVVTGDARPPGVRGPIALD